MQISFNFLLYHYIIISIAPFHMNKNHKRCFVYNNYKNKDMECSLLQRAFQLEYLSNKGGDIIAFGLPSTNTTTMIATEGEGVKQ